MNNVACTIAVAALIAGVMPVRAQTFPTRNLTILVPYAPGGPTDAAARIIGEHMAGTFGQHVLVENVTGGSGVIATTRVARSSPDGHTLLLHQLALAANVSLFPKAPFDVEKDLSAVGLVNTSPMIIVGRKTLAANSAAELAAWMKEPGRHVKFAHAGVGTLAHLCAALFAQTIGVEVDMIPYRAARRRSPTFSPATLICIAPRPPRRRSRSSPAPSKATASRPASDWRPCRRSPRSRSKAMNQSTCSS